MQKKFFLQTGTGTCTLNDVNSLLEVVRFLRGESDCFPAISGQINAGIPSPLGLQDAVATPDRVQIVTMTDTPSGR